MRQKSFQINAMLLVTAVIWGGGFVAQRLGMEQIGPYIFNGARFLIGAVTMVPILYLQKKRAPAERVPPKSIILIGAAAGTLLFGGATFQQLGLVYTTAGKAGFITGLYVIFVPLLGMLIGYRAPLSTWIGAVLAVFGLYFLSATRGMNLAPGDGYVLIGALFWAGHVQFLARFAPRVDSFRLSMVQSLVTSLLSFAVGFATEGFDPGQIQAAFWPIMYGGVISIGIAYTLQIIAQQSAKPTPAAIILSMESVFAAFWGWLILGEILSPRALAGSALMLAGMIISQIRPRGDPA